MALTIAISFDSPALLPPRIAITTAQTWGLASGDPLAYYAMRAYATTLTESLIINSIYNTGDAIMENVLNAYNGNFSDTADNTLTAISNAAGEMVGSLKIANAGGSVANVTIRIKDSSDVVLFECVETISNGSNLVAIDGLEKVILLDTNKITVQSDAAVSLFYYLSTLDGVVV